MSDSTGGTPDAGGTGPITPAGTPALPQDSDSVRVSTASVGALEHQAQSDEHRQAVIAGSTAGRGTAVGQAREFLAGTEDERLDGAPGGSTNEIAGGAPKPDHPGKTAHKPVGAQAEHANYAVNGTLPSGMIASGYGLTPVSSTTSSPEEAAALIKSNLDSTKDSPNNYTGKKIPRKVIDSLNAADLRSVASDRGYDVGIGGSRATRSKFIEAQRKDKSLKAGDDEE